MRPLASIRKVFWKGCCGTCHFLNLILALLAVHLTGLIFLNAVRQVVPLPELAAHWVVNRALGDRYTAAWQRAVFDLRAGLFLEAMVLKSGKSGETLLEAEAARMELAPLTYLLGLTEPLSQLEAHGVTLFLPAQLSPSGVNEPGLQVSHVDLRLDGDTLEARSLQLTSGPLGILLTGSGHLGLSADGAGGPEGGLGLLHRAVSAARSLPSGTTGFARIEWSRIEKGPHRLNIRFMVPMLDLPVGRFEAMSGQAHVVMDTRTRLTHLEARGDLTALQPLPALPFLPEISLPDPIRLDLNARGPETAHLSGWELPANWTLKGTASGPKPFFQTRSLRLATRLGSPDGPVDWLLSGPGLFASGQLIPSQNLPEGTNNLLNAPFQIPLRAYFHQPRLASFLPEPPEERLLQNAQADFVRFNGTVHTQPRRIEGSFISDGLHIGQTDFARLHATLSLSRENLQLDPIFVQKSPTEFADGAYHHHFPTTRFTLIARGASRPQSLNALLGDWWVDIFQQIHAEEALPADVAVWGNWRDPSSLRSVTTVRGEGARYREVAIPRITVRVRSRHEWTWLEELRGRFAEGEVRGSIAWQLNLPDPVRRPMLLDFRSNIPWEQVVELSGIEELGEMRIGGRPEVAASGVLWRPPRENPDLPVVPELQIELNADEEPFSVSGLNLRDVRFAGTVSEKRLNLPSVSGEFAEGVFTGSLQIADWTNRRAQSRYLRMQLFDASFSEAALSLTALLEDPEGLRQGIFREKASGRVDASVDLTLRPDLEQCEGTGRVILRRAEMGRIHLFGGLSRILSGMGLGFSSLELDSASLEWDLSTGILQIPDCQVTGPLVRLDLSGAVNLASRNLDLQADVVLFRGIVGQVLAPVSDNFQFDIRGSLESPSWQVRLTPFRWLQERFIPQSPDGG